MSILTVKLTLREPVLVTAPGGDPNTDESQSYIPGSALRGALVARYLQVHEHNRGPDFADLFLSGVTRFMNAYPAMGETRMLPTPAHWQREKDPVSGLPQDKQRVYDLTTNPQLKATTAVGGPFMIVSGTMVRTKQPAYEVAVHNARNRVLGRAVPNDVTNRSTLFRYHALAAGQSFIGQIVLPDELVETIRPLLEDTLLLGGSNTAGYGLTDIVELSLSVTRELDQPYADIAVGENFLVYLTSDAILRHPETGQPGAHLQECLQEELGAGLDVTQSYGRLGWVGGFNLYWGLPLPQTWAMLKGSVWQMRSDRVITAATIAQLEARGLGERREEGYGALVLVKGAWPTQPLFAPLRATRSPKPERAAIDFPRLTAAEASTLAAMNQRIARQELDRHLAVAAQAIQTQGLRLSNSQLARLRLKVRQNRTDLQSFITYLNGTTARKSADDQFRKSRIRVANQPHNFREWLLRLAANPEEVWLALDLSQYGWVQQGRWQRPLLGKDPYILTRELAVDYTIRLVDAICAQAQKGGRGS